MRCGWLTLRKTFERNPELVEILEERGEYFFVRAFAMTRLPGRGRWLRSGERTFVHKRWIVERFDAAGVDQS